MKTLANKTLIYDEDCPLCRVYTSGFVKAGMLDENGKKPYSQICTSDRIDLKRAANEIALVDNKNGETLYGIDSLLAVLGASFPWIGKVGKWIAVNFALRKAYKFISYNRKVIMPNPESAAKRPACLPDFNLRYRLAYLFFATAVTAVILHAYPKFLIPTVGFWVELLLVAAQIGFQMLFLGKQNSETKIGYAGNLLTVSMLGALLLLPMGVASRYFPVLAGLVTETWFFLVAGAIFFEHLRRVKLLRLPKILCATWVLYRLLFLAILLILFRL